MGSIVPRKRKDGTVGYSAQIVIKKDGKIVHRETKTFERRQPAAAWMRKREEALSQPGALERKPDTTLDVVIDRYVDESLKEIGRTKAQVLRSIKKFGIAKMGVRSIGSEEIVAFAKELVADKQPQTVGNYLSHLAAVFAVAKPAWGYDLDRQAMKDATVVLRRLGFISKSLERQRRPTLDELDKLMTYFAEREARQDDPLPMTKIVPFAIFSTRRQEEITRIQWVDFDRNESRILVRDMKNPGEKKGNDVWCDLVPEAIDIIDTLPAGELLFPFNASTISARFTRTCKMLGIEGLHFHDLRHEGISRLFEMGRTLPHVAAVSGHRSWASLKRYTHIRQTGDKYKDWKWKPKATPASIS